MDEQDRRLSADEAYEERWMTRYGFVIPRDRPDLLERFWQQEMALLEWQTALAWKNVMAATAAREAAMLDDQRNNRPT
ncbi:hypothetical protein AEMCBJ_01650 [Cupriavidus necator]|uniref:hypothetical protein n=1 Tax=Cupriavidus necator TaxID=106590 RepID=UPI003F73F8A1